MSNTTRSNKSLATDSAENSQDHAQELGKKGEELVAAYLRKEGFIILATNYATRRGEVDIIAQRGEVLAFVEVKTRKKTYFPINQVVTATKQQRIALAALDYAQRKGIQNKVLRFDVATVEYTQTTQSLNYIPNAFQHRRSC